MYATCLFCHADLGGNEVIEPFPVGRRLAFDASKGRLWVVCRKCERWNLSPLDERWEAIEECERLFSETRLRASTDNIGLARVREGLELVRIGNALRPELAAWRYGDQFGRRRRRHVVYTTAGIAALGGIAVLGPMSGIVGLGGWGGWQVAMHAHHLYQGLRLRVRLRAPEGDAVIPIRQRQLSWVSVVRHGDGWGLRVPVSPSWAEAHKSKSTEDEYVFTRRRLLRSIAPRASVLYTGNAALQAASRLLPAINQTGAAANHVQRAVELVGDAGDAMRLFGRYAARVEGLELRGIDADQANGHVVSQLPQDVRLALEMATHEEQERRALEGELALLEAAWREAEEVAKISDEMFDDETTLARLDALRNSD